MDRNTTVIKSDLATDNIYLDTTVFKTANFHYDSPIFRQLILLAEKGKIKLFITSITIREIKFHIRRDVEKAISSIKQSRKDARILRNISDDSFKWLFDDIDENEMFDSIFSLFEDFIKEVNVEIILIKRLNVEEVFDKYFSFQPPFSDSKKKEEFPDAFVIQAILEWCDENDESMYIISNDGDMVTSCGENERLYSLKKIEELLDLVSFKDVNISAFATAAFNHCKRDIEASIKNEFEFLGFLLVDEDGDIENVEVTEVRIINEYLINADENSAYFNIEAEIEFNADVSYDDMSTAYRDSDTKDLVAVEVIDTTITRTVTLSSDIAISFNIENEPELALVEYVKIDQKDIEVRIDEDWYPYSYY